MRGSSRIFGLGTLPCSLVFLSYRTRSETYMWCLRSQLMVVSCSLRNLVLPTSSYHLDLYGMLYRLWWWWHVGSNRR